MTTLLKNFCSAELALDVVVDDVQITVAPGHNLPTTMDNFIVVVWNAAVYPNPADDVNTEILLAHYSGTANVYNVTRAQESTTAKEHGVGDEVAIHLTAGTLSQYEPIVTKGNLTAGSTKVSISGVGSGALIGSGASIDIIPGNIPHNDLSGLQGGAVGQYHHLNSTQVSGLHYAVTLAVSADVLFGLTGQEISLDVQTATHVLAGPVSGAAAVPTFRALVSTDIPALAYEVSGATSTHAALTTGVHGLVITAGKTITITNDSTLDQDCRTTASPVFAGLTVDTDTLYVDKVNHRLGVGTTVPDYRLHFKNSTMIFMLESTSGGARMQLKHFTAANYWRVQAGLISAEDFAIGYGADSPPLFRITGSGGNIGIGVTGDAAEKLEVAGKIRANTAFNLNGIDGVSNSSAGIPIAVTVAGGIVTAITKTTYANTTFTPTVTLVGGAGNTVPVYTTNSGRYTRIGNRCFVDIFLDGDGGDEGAGTGQINIALPVQASASNLTDYIPAGHFHNGTLEKLCYVQIAGGATTGSLFLQDTDTVTAAATGADQNNTTRAIRLSFSYEV